MSDANSAGADQLPPELLAAAARADAQIVVVMGAGCSLDAPTSLELAGDLANRICDNLIANGSLPADAVGDPRDLSQLASVVFGLTGSQRLVVDEFPPAAFRSAQPNDGHMTLAALMREGVVGNTLSLNFDLSVSTAISMTGAGREVRVLKGPEDHSQQGPRNLIYLHRNIESDPDELILRTEQLETAWKQQWEDVVAKRVLSGPITVFVGLGSPAGVLTETATWIRQSLDAETVYVVGPGAPEASGFFQSLQVAPERYIQLGWCEFMFALGGRVLAQHKSLTAAACRSLVSADSSRTDENTETVCERIAALGVLGAGRLRARWFLEDGAYMPHPTDPRTLNLLADLVLGVAMLERLVQREAQFDDEGVAVFHGPRRQISVLIASAQGVMSWERATAEVARKQRNLLRRNRTVDAALVAGIVGSRDRVAVPENIAGEVDKQSVAAGHAPEIVSLDEMRATPQLAESLVA